MLEVCLRLFRMRTSLLFPGVLLFAIFAFPANGVSAAELIVNGSFETGNFTGWTTVNASNSFINWNVSGPGAGGGFIPVPVVTSPVHGTRVAWQGIACNAGSSYILYQDVAIPAATTAQLRWRDRFQDNLSEFCGGSGEPVCGTVTYRVDVVNTSNVVLQNLQTWVAPANSNTDTGWQLHIANLTPFAGQTVRIRFMTTPTVTWDGPGQLEVDGVSLQAPSLASSASTTVRGRVIDSNGNGIAKTLVVMDDSTGLSRTAITNPFGYYSFEDVPTGQTYSLSVSSKRYQFVNPLRILTIMEAVNDADFNALP